jgi:hypothetical protein
MMAEPFGDQSVRHAAWIIRQADELLSGGDSPTLEVTPSHPD